MLFHDDIRGIMNLGAQFYNFGGYLFDESFHVRNDGYHRREFLGDIGMLFLSNRLSSFLFRLKLVTDTIY
jgi:hypothetical protein